MKIGVIGCFYGNPDLLEEVLRPWIKLKSEGYPIVLGGINAQFKEYADMGYPNDDHETRRILEAHRSDFDELFIEEKPLMEHEVRTKLFNSLRLRGVDAIWLLDGDELYAVEDIKNILRYVERVPEFDYYHIHFENYLFDELKSRDVFCPPRIIRTDRRGGIVRFSWDNEIEFADGSNLYEAVPGIVPKKYAHVRHLTWRKNQIAKKIAYSNQHFGLSIFKEDEVTKEIVYNPEWFKKYKLPVPVRYQDGTVGTPTPLLEVYVELSCYASLRSLWSLVRMLLVFDRANDAFLRVIVRVPSEFSLPQDVKLFLDLFALDVEYRSEEIPKLLERSSADLIFLASDTMLYQKEALLDAYHSFWYFSKMMNRKEIVLSLVDTPELYQPESIDSSYVVRGVGSHWRTVPFTLRSGLLVPRQVASAYAKELAQEEKAVSWAGRLVAFGALPTLAAPTSQDSALPPFATIDAWQRELDSMPRPEK